MSGCSGKCCSVFNFPRTPEELAKRAEKAPWGPEQAANDRFLADMLVSLTPDEAAARAERFDLTPPEGMTLQEWTAHTESNGPLYTCSHWDEETRLCTVYEERPQMCRDYPYDRGCQHDCECSYRPPPHTQTFYAAQRVRSIVRAGGV